MRDRLIELIDEYTEPLCARDIHQADFAEKFADHLISEGVIVPPCKVGQTVFFVYDTCDENGKEGYTVSEGEVVSFSLQKEGLWAYCRYKGGLTYWHLVEEDFGKTVFLTKELAEKALKERREE